MEWVLYIIYSLIAVGTIASAIITYYKWIYYPKREKRERIKNIFLRPLLKIIPSLKEEIEQYSIPNLDPLSKLFDKHNSEVTNELTTLKGDLERRIETYRDWLSEANDFISGRIWYIVYYQGIVGNKLATEYEEKGIGSLGHDLVRFLATPILEGQKITISWFNDNVSEKYTEAIKNCKRYQDFKNTLGLIDKIRERQVLKKLREERDFLLKYLDETVSRLKGSLL
ncbi:MAG: hypothetical protein KAJ44_04685 [Thermoplasmatales archaeon]|nr:hypothetical protein [Thermoplasmatales archaeon]